ncbi:MAG: IS1634 family transposase, partial [Gaiellaceae bacterium]
VKRLAKKKAIQPSLFDELNLGEVVSDDYPGERLVVCRNPLVADDRRRRRQELLAATERELAPLRARVEAGTPRRRSGSPSARSGTASR